MRYLLIIAVVFMACEGPVGPAGIQGEPGPGTRTVISGNVTSDLMSITIEGLTAINPPVIDVHLCNSSRLCYPLPVTIFENDIASYTATHSIFDGGIWLLNALRLVGSGTYTIVIIE